MTTLWFYQCQHCKTWAVTLKDAGPCVNCNGCRGLKRYKHKQPEVPGDTEVIAYARKHGVAHLPLPRPMQMNPCVRCALEFPNYALRRRPDGLTCRECYQAEEHPPVALLTPEEVKAELARQRQETRDYDDHHQLSQEHNQ